MRPIAEMEIPEVELAGLIRLTGVVVIAKISMKYNFLNSSPSSSFTITSGVNTSKPGKGRSVLAAWGGSGEALARELIVDME